MTLMGVSYDFDAPRIEPIPPGTPYVDPRQRGAHAVQIESGAVDERPGLKPPSDPAAEGWTWAAWKRELDAGALPGWAVCRFANRTGPDNAAFVFGVARGSFGIWRQPFNVCAPGAPTTEVILTCVTHLRSGLGIGIFTDREVAAAAAEIADRVCPAWETLDPDDRVKWHEVHSRTNAAWHGIGVRHSEDSHCHDTAGGTYRIYTRSPESLMAGRPEKLS
jgi:hypothetical protein